MSLHRGSTIGRYVLLDMLGRGGMGVVFAAYDPELDRKVAIKLVRYADGGGAVGTVGRTRLLREAQALAKLSHRNIVSVYDVGIHQDSVFVAMEFIEGTTLGAWMEQRSDAPRHWREVLHVFVPAGRALAAAHRAGIIHRDFKPDNVMIDGTGRVVVLDFGLARPTEAAASPTSTDALPPESTALGTQLTVAGAVMGTPAYMSPEQFAGKDTDATTDQFSFCVAVYAALFGERPFEGASLAELAASVLGQPPRAAPKGSGVPPWLRRAVERGLARERGDRHPSMDALIDALLADPARGRRRLALAGLAVAALGAVAWGATELGAAPDPCTDIASTFARIGGGDRRAAIRSAFRTDARSYSDDALARVEQALDDYGARWTALRTSACEGGRDATMAPEANLRATCLDGQLRRLDAITRVLADADQQVVERAVGVLKGPPGPERCEDAAADRSPPPVPHDPAMQERVERLRTRVLDVPTLVGLGHIKDATDLGEELLAEARATDFGPVIGEVAVALGKAMGQQGRYDDALALLEEGSLIARQTRHEVLAREASWGLVYLHTTYTHRLDLAEWLIRDWEAMPAGATDPPEDRAHVMMARAVLARERGRYEEAAASSLEAIALLEAADDEDINLIIFLDNLANLYVALERFDDALEAAARARVIADRAVGATHPLQADLRLLTARVRADQGRDHESIALLLEALEIYEGAYGESSPHAAAILNGLGLEYETVGQPAEALAALQRAHRIQHDAGAGEHVQAAIIAANLGNVLRRLERADEAIPYHREALALRERRGGDDEALLEVRDNLADDLRVLDRCAEAETEYRIAIEGRERKLGPEVAELAYPLIGLGLCRLRAGDVASARPLLDRAVRLIDDDADRRDTAGMAHLALAMALRRAGQPAATVDHHVDRARAHLATDPVDSAPLLAALERFAAGDELVDLIY